MNSKHLWILLAFAQASCSDDPSPDNPVGPTSPSPGEGTPSLGEERPQRTPNGTPGAAQDWGEIRLSRDDELRVSRATRISVETQFAPGIAAALHLPDGAERSYANRVSDACVRALRATGKPASIVAAPGEIADDGTNVLVRLTVGPNAEGTPYRVSLAASQKDAHWSASIERPGFRYVPGNIPIRPDRTTPDGRPYWDAARDTDALAGRLCDHLLSGSSNAGEE